MAITYSFPANINPRGLACVYSMSFNGLTYIGATNNLRRRATEHLNAAKSGAHHNRKVREALAADADGCIVLAFKVLRICEGRDAAIAESEEIHKARACERTELANETGPFILSALNPETGETFEFCSLQEASDWLKSKGLPCWDSSVRQAADLQHHRKTAAGHLWTRRGLPVDTGVPAFPKSNNVAKPKRGNPSAVRAVHVASGEFRDYPSIASACRSLGVRKTLVHRVLRGEATHTRGYRFERIGSK